jgi:hypothetical protein
MGQPGLTPRAHDFPETMARCTGLDPRFPSLTVHSATARMAAWQAA